MKKISILFFLCVTLFVNAQYSPLPPLGINETNFPDANFRNWVLAQSYGQDGVLTDDEIKAVTRISVSDMSIQSLKGIEYFTALKRLDCDNNGFNTLDISNLTALEELRCRNNGLTSLDVTKNAALIAIKCSDNSLTSLDLSKNPALIDLECFNNRLTALDMSNNPYMEELECYNNQLTSLVLASKSPLQQLKCYQNNINGAGMDALIASLPTISSEVEMKLIYNVNESNVITSQQIAASAAKGWIPQYFDGTSWQKYSVEPAMKCSTPTITYAGGKLTISCETEGVEYEYYISTPHFNTFDENIAAPEKLMFTVIATKDGYEPSDAATQEIDKRFFQAKKGDVNEDGTVNGTDIQEVINIIVSGE